MERTFTPDRVANAAGLLARSTATRLHRRELNEIMQTLLAATQAAENVDSSRVIELTALQVHALAETSARQLEIMEALDFAEIQEALRALTVEARAAARHREEHPGGGNAGTGGGVVGAAPHFAATEEERRCRCCGCWRSFWAAVCCTE